MPVTGNNVSWEVYAFEANPTFNSILIETKNEVVLNGHTVNLFNETAAWIYDGTIVFYLDTVNTDRNFWGSSLNKKHPDVVKSGINVTSVTVKCVDIARLIKQYKVEDIIVLKVDIEGAEYDLLMDFFKKDVFKLIDYIAVEFHPYIPVYSTESILMQMMNVSGVQLLKWS